MVKRGKLANVTQCRLFASQGKKRTAFFWSSQPGRAASLSTGPAIGTENSYMLFTHLTQAMTTAGRRSRAKPAPTGRSPV